VISGAAASKTTARSHRNSTVVGALIGLILGGIAALLWDPFVERRARR
jgi:gas vesicle protein